MKTTKRNKPAQDPEAQLKGFIARFAPEHQTLLRAMRKALRKRLPTAHELVYDNYNFFVIGYGPTERPSDAILSLTGASNGVGLCFTWGANLPDPQKVLRGSGNQVRSIHVESVEVLERPAVQALITAAIDKAKAPFQPKGRGNLIIRSISTKQRPRRRAVKSR
jgi:hypothetical protein